jgi:hypothetical protein
VTWIFVAINCLGIFLNVYRKIICWLVWEVAAIGLMVHNYQIHEYSQMALWIGYGITNIWGFIAWGGIKWLKQKMGKS